MNITTLDQFADILTSKGYAFKKVGGKIVVTHSWFVNLSFLTSLPDGTKFENRGGVHLSNLTSPFQTYLGKQITLRTIDSYTMLCGRTKAIGDVSIMTARYFGGGDIAKLKRCYVASQGDVYAHGETAETAMRDLRFKIAQVNFDASDLIAKVKKAKKITFNEFRLLTGACESGLQHGLQQLGLDANTEELQLDRALKLVRGQFGEHKMMEAFGK